MLSVAQRVAIRALADNPNAVDRLPGSTYGALVRRDLIHPSSGQLTDAGWRAHREIMASGDGPEDLKELLRF